ncbi:MAG: hypothetical protein ACAH80_14280 [Alphaproteobacteria bacterium]
MTTLLSLNSFQAKYKYKIAGETDLVLSRVGIVVKDKLLFSTLKNSRTREIVALNNIESSTTMTDGQKDKAAAEARLAFARDATRLFKTSRSEGKSTAKTQINAVSAIVKDLSTAVSEYNAARNAGETTAAEDTAFANAVKALHTSYKGLVLTLKGLLRNEGQFYNVNMEQTRKYLDEIQAGLDALDAPPVAPLTVSADSSSGGSLDITV